MQLKPLLFSFFLSLGVIAVQQQAPAQVSGKDTTASGEDLMNMLNNDPAATQKEYTTATFKTTRLVNGHSIENTGKGVLDFKISHRFGRVDQGIKDLFGFDGATTRIGFDYGVTDWLTAGFGRSSYEKEYDGYLKLRILRQTENTGMPISLSYVGGMSVRTDDAPPLQEGQTYHFSSRLYYFNQLLIARKFNEWLSVQLMPTHVHYNLVDTHDEPNDVLAMGVGGRLKLSRRITLNAEYYYQLPSYQLDHTVNSLSVGVDIETGGHVFQLHFTNSTGMTERTFIGQTADKWDDGGAHFGFNISRVFTIAKPKGFKNSRNRIY